MRPSASSSAVVVSEDVLARREPKGGSERSNLFINLKEIHNPHRYVFWCRPPTPPVSATRSLSVIFSDTETLTRSWPAKSMSLADREFVPLWMHRGPIWINSTVSSVPAWLTPDNRIWKSCGWRGRVTKIELSVWHVSDWVWSRWLGVITKPLITAADHPVVFFGVWLSQVFNYPLLIHDGL